jgi:microsomal dipeptidase-like Zn-dependent dipeptidase
VSTDVFGLASRCVAVGASAPSRDRGPLLAASPSGAAFEFVENELSRAARIALQATDLGSYLLRDGEGRYVVGSEDGSLLRLQTLESDVSRNEDGYVSPAEWDVLAIAGRSDRFHLRQHTSGRFLGTQRLVSDVGEAAEIAFYPAEGCTSPPELSLDAEGRVSKTQHADGTLFGIVDAHSHLFSNLAFGGGGVFHGAPYHRLGVEHALPSCERVHGAMGERDILGNSFRQDAIDLNKILTAFLTGSIGAFDHRPEGYPQFSDWPNSWKMMTHQLQYHRWVQRAYLGGLRLLVQHSTSSQVLCELTAGINSQTPRSSCNEMVAAKRMFEETRAMERYIDAQHGGPGKGWFRLVKSPAEARAVIAGGKLAVILGIETSNLFDCFLTPPPGTARCDEETVRKRLDEVYALGARVLFPVHKFDNAFSAGDGHRGFIEFGNFVSSGHYGNYTSDGCPDVPAVYDHGPVTFGGLNAPRDVYDAPPPVDMSRFRESPVDTLSPHLPKFQRPALAGDHCQKAGLQPLGEFLMKEMMLRGMIIEVDHMPRRAYARAYELLRRYDYPAAGTHGSDNRGELYKLGGISTLRLDRCVDPADREAGPRRHRERIASIERVGAYAAQGFGFGFDFNGFARGPRPRFGKDSACAVPQSGNGITYPFTSLAGDVTFLPPQLGERRVDFDTEGMIHLGLLPELIQDARNVGYTDADLDPIFRSAEGYLRMWERAERRAEALRTGGP